VNADTDNLLKGLSRESTIRRDALGRWFHDGEPVAHPGLIRCFDRWISRAEDGRYTLRNARDWVYITLQGPPLFVRAARVEDAGAIRLLLSDETEEALDPDTLRQGPDGALYCDARDGTMTARFDSGAMAQLADAVDEDAQGVYIRVAARRVRPPVVDNPLEPARREAAQG
jgi:hypothetical protein